MAMQWFKAFRSPTFQLKFTMVDRKNSCFSRFSLSNNKDDWKRDMRARGNHVVYPADRDDLVVDLEELEEEEENRIGLMQLSSPWKDRRTKESREKEKSMRRESRASLMERLLRSSRP
jgi:hypothetical protein